MAGKERRGRSKAGCPVVVFEKQSWRKVNQAIDAHFHQRKGTSAAQPKKKSLQKAQDMTKTAGGGNCLLDPRERDLQNSDKSWNKAKPPQIRSSGIEGM